MNRNRWIGGLLAAVLLLPGCGKQVPDEYWRLDDETRAQRNYVNTFAWNVMDSYYLWRDEIADALENWENWEEPIAKVAAIRYKDARGKDIDRWTRLTDDFASFTGGISGHTRTLGMDFQLYYADQTHTRICAVVTFVYAGSPAAEAGIGRGDTIRSVNGYEMTTGNYEELVMDGILGGGTVTLGFSGGKSVRMTAVDMYENPVHTVRILEQSDGRKIGYLHYTSFTLDSCQELIDVFNQFTQEGIDDLVLDLRYNSGGYVITETVLASMLAPVAEVTAGSIFSTEVYNTELAKEMGNEPTYFKNVFSFKSDGKTQVLSTAGANPDLPRLYVLVTGSSASASESLVCCLKPYMDITLIGGQTSGKYCAGFLMSAESWYGAAKESLQEGEYEKALPFVDNWGIYVMYSRYADRNGKTLSMPDGIVPDYEVADNPLDGYDLGDPKETMLAYALGLIDARWIAGKTRSADSPALLPVLDAPRRPGFGVLVGEGPVR